MTNGLFKYFPTDPDKLERFTNGCVYLTPPKHFNDPWDFLVRSEEWTGAQVEEELLSTISPQDMAAFTNYMNSPSLRKDEALEQWELLSHKVGVVSLTEEHL